MNSSPATPAVTADFSVVIPCYNEADNILVLVEEVAAACRDLAFEILVVDDASTDESASRIRRAMPSFGGRLRLIQHRRNAGQSAGVCSGVDAARGRIVVTLDGDGQNDPADIPALVAALGEHAGQYPVIICGHRQRRQDTWVRRLSSRIANGVRARALGDATPDTGCGLKAFERSLFMQLPRFNHMHRFLPALVRRSGGEAVSVPVNHRPRLHGQSKYGIGNRLWVGIVDIFGVMWLQRRAFRSTSTIELGAESPET